MARVVGYGLKGFIDDRSGAWKFTPEVQVEGNTAEPLTPEQKGQLMDNLTALKDVLVTVNGRWPETKPRAVPDKAAEAKEPVINNRDRGMTPTATQTPANGRKLNGYDKPIPDHPDPVKNEAGQIVYDIKDGYDPVTGSWQFCPLCGNQEVHHVSGAGKPYSACKKCNKWLNRGGVIAEGGWKTK